MTGFAGVSDGTGAEPNPTEINCLNGVGEGSGATPNSLIIINGVSDGTGAKPDNSSQCTVIQNCDNYYVLSCSE